MPHSASFFASNRTGRIKRRRVWPRDCLGYNYSYSKKKVTVRIVWPCQHRPTRERPANRFGAAAAVIRKCACVNWAMPSRMQHRSRRRRRRDSGLCRAFRSGRIRGGAGAGGAVGQARRAFHACMAALTDALIAHAEPETHIVIDWPDAIFVNSGLVGGGRLAWPEIRERRRGAGLAGVRRHDPHRRDCRCRAGA